MKPFEIYAGSDGDGDDGVTPVVIPVPPSFPRQNADQAFVIYDDDSPERENEETLWNMLTASNERLSPEAIARLESVTTPVRTSQDAVADIVTPVRALSLERTDSADPFTPFSSASATAARGRPPEATPMRVRPTGIRHPLVPIDRARNTVVIKTPSSENGEGRSERQSLLVQLHGAAAIDTTRNLIKTLKTAILMTHALNKDGETAVVVSELAPRVKNRGPKGVTCTFLKMVHISREENADAIRPNIFDPVRVDAPSEYLGVFTVIPAYFRGTRGRQGDVPTVEPCNLMYSVAGSDVTVIQPGTVEHVSTVNHVILTLASSQFLQGARPLIKLAIHKRVWAYGLDRLSDTLHFVNIPLRGSTGETFDCSISAKVVAAAAGGEEKATTKGKRPSLAYVFITGVKFSFPPSVRSLSVEQIPVLSPLGGGGGGGGGRDRTPIVRARRLFSE